MRLYYEVAVRAFRRATVYRIAYLAGLITNAFFGAMLSFVYLGVYGAEGRVVGGMDSREAISYLWAAQAMIAIGGGWLSNDLTQQIKSGAVAVDLMRPWHFYGYWLSQQLGDRLFNLLLRGSLTYLIGVLYFNAYPPALDALALFLPAVLLSILTSSAYSFIANVTAFWLIDNTGVMLIGTIILMFFSGFLMPLAFFPPVLAAIARALPFQAITGIPVQIFLGQIDHTAILQTFLLQLGWALFLTCIALLLMRAAMKKVVIQGG